MGNRGISVNPRVEVNFVCGSRDTWNSPVENPPERIEVVFRGSVLSRWSRAVFSWLNFAVKSVRVHFPGVFQCVCVWCCPRTCKSWPKKSGKAGDDASLVKVKVQGWVGVVGAAWRCTPEGKNDRSGKFPSFYGFSVLFWRFVALFFRPVRSVGSQLDLHNPDSSRYQCNKSKRPCYPGLPVLHFFFRSLLIACQ